jgi:hypothetical protein
MNPRVYVAAPYIDAPLVRELHDRLRALGCVCTSAWAEVANGEEHLEALTANERASLIAANDTAVATADVVIVLARHGAGGEMFAEARLAELLEIPILWVGERRTLGAYREGVRRVAAIDMALEHILAGWPRRNATEPPDEHAAE